VIEREKQIEQFLTQNGLDQATRLMLVNDASSRRYYRLETSNKQSFILMDAPQPHENVRDFIKIDRHLIKHGYSAPRLLAINVNAGLLLLEDFGNNTFTKLLASGENEKKLYHLAVDQLIDMHSKGQAIIPPNLSQYSDQCLLNEILLFYDWYVKEMYPLAPQNVRNDYIAIWQALFSLVRTVPTTLVLRDFHVDNLLRLDSRNGISACGLLDFQDAIVGPITYDLVSLLEDARRDIDHELIIDMKRYYINAFPNLNYYDFITSWAVIAAQRHAKVIGIFTRLYRRDKKSIYLQHIPRVWHLLEQALTNRCLIDLKDWFDYHLPKDKRKVPQ
jgi:aminoglycoside/choline kinase family phosphotransferase